MVVPDLNLVLYAEIDAFPEHAGAARWWVDLLSGGGEVGLGAPVVFGFIRLTTNPRVFAEPLDVGAAVDRVEAWLSIPSVRLLLPGPRHLEVSFSLLRQLGAAGNLTTDVQLAALAIEHQAELHSNDVDFGRFAGLRWINPLRAEAR